MRAAIRAAWPMPPRSSNWKSNPRALPSSTTEGGGKAKIMALRSLEKAAMALPAIAFTLKSGRFRRLQSFSLIQTMPFVWALPEKPTPATVMVASTPSFSLVLK